MNRPLRPRFRRRPGAARLIGAGASGGGNSVAVSRRKFLLGGAASLGALSLAGCDNLSSAPWFRRALGSVDNVTRGAQRVGIGRDALAEEYAEADISPVFRANGTTQPDTMEYINLALGDFADYRLVFDGLVANPLSLSVADLRAMSSRTQITRHDCVEGWSCIGKWKGTPLREVIALAGLKPEARFLVFHCYDWLERSLDGTGQYYESLDLIDANHPQTIIAYEMNDQTLPIAHGAPLRLRVERQLGYKQPKYLQRIEAVESFAQFGRGQGGYWEDRGYEWYGGI